MVGQFLYGRWSRLPLQAQGNSPVQQHASRGTQITLHHLADHIVRETVGGCILCYQQPSVAGRIQGVEHLLRRARRYYLQQAIVRRAADHCGDAEHPPGRLGQPGDPLSDALHQVPRHRVGRAGLRLLAQPLGAAHQEERDTARPLQYPRAQVRARRLTGEQFVEQLRGLLQGQRTEQSPRGQPCVDELGKHGCEGCLGRHLGVPVDADDAQRCVGYGMRQRGQQVEGVCARPLQVVEHQQRARRPAYIGQETCHRGEHQPALLLGRDGSGGQRFNGTAGKLGEQPDQPGAAA